MTPVAQAPASASFPAIGTTAVVLVTEPAGLAEAERLLREDLRQLDLAASRFRTDSEIMRLDGHPGQWIQVSPLLADAIAAALHAAAATDGLVDPTVLRAMVDLGYDRDFAEIADGPDRDAATQPTRPQPDNPRPALTHRRPPRPVPGWRRVEFDRAGRRIRLPLGVSIDLGATAKALAADQAATRISAALDCGVLVSLGGDIAVAGQPPATGWLVEIGDDHTATATATDPVITLRSGALATSSVARRTWLIAGQRVHHIVDPRTGDAAVVYWRTVSVAAASCVDANAATTAAIVMGEPALTWLSRLGLPARLVRADGLVATTSTWPEPGGWPTSGMGPGHPAA